MLDALPGSFDLLGRGGLTVEQSKVMAEALAGLQPGVRASVWSLLRARLEADADRGVARPPARLRELLRRLIARVDADGAAARRRAAASSGDVVRQRRDGLVDLYASGLSGPDAAAVLARLADCAARPVDGADDRTVGARRRDPLVDLLLGRQPFQFGADTGSAAGCPGSGTGSGLPGAASCGCLPGTAGPCGAELVVLVPVGAALGTTDETAELIGHGVLHGDELTALLRNSPRLKVSWVDETGLPVALGDRTWRPGRDPDRLRQALLGITATPPPPPEQRQPRHPNDHASPEHSSTDLPPEHNAVGPPPEHDAVGLLPERDATGPPLGSAPVESSAERAVAPDPVVVPPGLVVQPEPVAQPAAPPQPVAGCPAVLVRPHPAGTPGPYRVPATMQRFLAVRSPRDEWPGSGARTRRCDLDLAWPAGPTCPCNFGPLTRHHHRAKQTGMLKTRQSDGSVLWTSPTGRTWTSPVQHDPPQPPARRLPPLPARDDDHEPTHQVDPQPDWTIDHLFAQV